MTDYKTTLRLGVVNHCTEENRKKHWHVFWDFDNCSEEDVAFAAIPFLEKYFDVMVIQSSPNHYHLIIPNLLTKAEARKMESWVADQLTADYLGMDAEDFITGCSGATLRLSEKNGCTPYLLGIYGKSMMPVCEGLLSLYQVNRTVHCIPETVVAKPTLVIYQDREVILNEY